MAARETTDCASGKAEQEKLEAAIASSNGDIMR
jgi:hypothetical protein